MLQGNVVTRKELMSVYGYSISFFINSMLIGRLLISSSFLKQMMDANQRWDVGVAKEHMSVLSQFKPLWIEEPTSPDDILGHAAIATALKDTGVGVATGEHCQNRVIFKQMMQANAISFCQIDSCRVGGVNENLAIILMAMKYGGTEFFILFRVISSCCISSMLSIS